MKPFFLYERSRCAPQARITRSMFGKFRRRGLRPRDRLWPGVGQLDRIEEVRDRLADRGPIRPLVVARPDQRLAQCVELRGVVQFGEPGPAEQRPQGRIGERGPVELSEMRIAAAIEQQRIADIVERRPVLSSHQRAAGGSGEIMKRH